MKCNGYFEDCSLNNTVTWKYLMADDPNSKWSWKKSDSILIEKDFKNIQNFFLKF